MHAKPLLTCRILCMHAMFTSTDWPKFRRWHWSANFSSFILRSVLEQSLCWSLGVSTILSSKFEAHTWLTHLYPFVEKTYPIYSWKAIWKNNEKVTAARRASTIRLITTWKRSFAPLIFSSRGEFFHISQFVWPRPTSEESANGFSSFLSSSLIILSRN